MGMNALFKTGKVVASGLKANRQCLNVISNNIANASSLNSGEHVVRNIPTLNGECSVPFLEHGLCGKALVYSLTYAFGQMDLQGKVMGVRKWVAPRNLDTMR